MLVNMICVRWKSVLHREEKSAEGYQSLQAPIMLNLLVCEPNGWIIGHMHSAAVNEEGSRRCHAVDDQQLYRTSGG